MPTTEHTERETTMASATATPKTETGTEEETPRWQIERETHGAEAIGQLIGNLTRDANVEVPEDETKKPYIWGGVAVNRGPDMKAAFHTFYIYGVKTDPESDEDDRPTVEQLEEFASKLTKGQRVKIQGRTDVRPVNDDLYEAACAAAGVKADSKEARELPWLREFFFSGRSTMRIFLRPDELDLDATFDKKGRRSVTLLPRIGEDKEDDGLPFG